MAKLKTQEEFIKQVTEIHGDKYDYSKTVYVNDRAKVTIICHEHGEFTQVAGSHIQGNGCKTCGALQAGQKMVKTTAEFIHEASLKHDCFYDYSPTMYTTAFKKVDINCPLHGKFSQPPHAHIKGHGCEICGNLIKAKKHHNKPTTLYSFKIKDVWKVGITTRKLPVRYSMDYKNITDITTIVFPNGEEAFNKEQTLIANSSQYKYTGCTPFTDGTGITECFTRNILNKDNL